MIELSIQGASCGHCVKAIKEAVHQIDADASVEVDLEGGKVRISRDSQADAFKAAIEDAGYPASLV